MEKSVRAALLLGASLALAGFGAGPALAYFGVVAPEAGFGLFALSCVLGVLVTLGVAAAAMKYGSAKWLPILLLCAIPTVYLLYSIAATRDYPLINDISTERIYPPEFVYAAELPENAAQDLKFPPAFKEIIDEHYPDIRPLAMIDDADAVFARAMDLAKQREGWTVTGTTLKGDVSSFEVVAVSKIFRFHDDVIVRVTKVENGCVVDVRSRSRVGKGDLGANAARIREFLQALNS